MCKARVIEKIFQVLRSLSLRPESCGGDAGGERGGRVGQVEQVEKVETENLRRPAAPRYFRPPVLFWTPARHPVPQI